MDDIEFRKDPRPSKYKPERPEQYISPDGKARPPGIERQLNEAFAVTFNCAAGQMVLDYLKSISLNRVLPPGTPPDTITYHEGARWLAGVIDTRIQHGEGKKP